MLNFESIYSSNDPAILASMAQSLSQSIVRVKDNDEKLYKELCKQFKGLCNFFSEKANQINIPKLKFEDVQKDVEALLNKVRIDVSSFYDDFRNAHEDYGEACADIYNLFIVLHNMKGGIS